MSRNQQEGNSERKSERIIGDYRLVAELARGGMGRVYLARRCGQAGFERFFAVKVMSHQLSDDHDARLMLLDEAHIASRLHHPNVVSVLDIGTYDEGYYLVMDYVEGCSFQQLLRRSPNVRSPQLIVPILIEALRGLHAVHMLRNAGGQLYGVVHRDVSPHNLLLGVDGGCRVTDFGIAKARERFTDTQVGVYKGKLAFMAPEQLRGASSVDCRADVWAAGVTLYTALTGEHPFRGESDATTLHNVLSAELPQPSEVGLRPPVCLDEVVMRALERDPDQRFASAQEFGDALRSVAISEGLLGSPAEIAQWVETSCGADLADRRRRIAELPRSDGETVTGATSSVPRLWFAGETNGGTSSGATPDATRWDPPRSSLLTASIAAKPRTWATAALAFTAMTLGGAMAFMGHDGVHTDVAKAARETDVAKAAREKAAAVAPPHRISPALAPAPIAPVAPAPVKDETEANAELTAGEDVTAAPKHDAQGPLPDKPDLRLRRAHKPASAKPRASEREHGAPEQTVEQSAPDSGDAEGSRVSSPPQHSEPDSTRARPLERNPYLLGE